MIRACCDSVALFLGLLVNNILFNLECAVIGALFFLGVGVRKTEKATCEQIA